MPNSARGAFSNALGFFKAQKNEEKKSIQDKKHLVESKLKTVPEKIVPQTNSLHNPTSLMIGAVPNKELQSIQIP